MKYQITLQFSGETEEDFNNLIEIEDRLIEELEDKADVDGHDFGSGEMNIFILTNKPKEIFDKISSFLKKNNYFQEFKAAYRELTKEKYQILWPENLEEFTVK